MAQVEPPLDILNRIMDFVSVPQSLLSCAISSRILRGPSQRMLFTSVTFPSSVDLSEASERWEIFCEALSTSSDLGHHVKSLGVRAILLTDQTILTVFSKTRNLSSLIIGGETVGVAANDTTVMPWIRLQPQTRRFLSQDVFPRVTSLGLLDLTDIPAEIFEYLTSIRSLECSDNILPLSEDFLQDLPKTIEPHPVKRLDLTRSYQPELIGYMALANYFHLHNCQLQEVSLFQGNLSHGMISPAALQALVSLFASSKATLQALYINGQDKFLMEFGAEADYKKWFEGFYNLEQYTALTTLVVNLSLDATYIGNEDIDEYIERLVEIFLSGRPTPISAGLRIVCINAEFPTDDDRQSTWWNPIVHALSTISTIQKVYFNIQLVNQGEFGDWYEGNADYYRRVYSESKTVLEDVLKSVGSIEKSEIALNTEWDLSVHNSLT